MKKVILRLFIVALVVALIVLLLFNTVFKVTDTEKAYDALSAALGENGQIVSLSNSINEMDAFNISTGAYAKYTYIYTAELKTLEKIYPKLHYVKGIDDGSAKGLIDNIDSLTKSLQTINKSISDIKGAQSNDVNIDINAYIDVLKPQIVSVLEKIVTVNNVLNKFLVKHYYGSICPEVMFIDSIKSLYAKGFYDCAEEDYLSDDTENAFNSYVALEEMDKNLLTIYNINGMHEIMDIVGNLSLDKIINSYDSYVESYQEDEAQLANIELIAQYLESLSLTIKGR